MRAKICLLAALSLSFDLAQVKAGCLDPCNREHEEFSLKLSEECGCDGADVRELGPGCQLYAVEYEIQVNPGVPVPNSCRTNATDNCRNAVQQWAKEYPDTCKECTMNRRGQVSLTLGALAIRMAENCPTEETTFVSDIEALTGHVDRAANALVAIQGHLKTMVDHFFPNTSSSRHENIWQ